MLKNIAIAILCVFCFNYSAKAQFSMDEDSLFADGWAATGFVDLSAHTKIRNTTTDTAFVKWERIDNTLPPNWTSAVCDVNLCHGETVNTANFYLLPNSSGELSFHFYPSSFAGKGKMIVRFSKISDPSYYIDVFINCQAYGLGVHTVENTLFRVYPNPATNSITIGSEKIKEGTFEIFNLMGEKVMANTFSGSQQIDVSSLAKGVYSIAVQNETAMASSKLIIE